LVPKLKKSATSAISSAVTRRGDLDHRADLDLERPVKSCSRRGLADRLLAQLAQHRELACTPTSGIMISGIARTLRFVHSIAASVIARTCILRISG
jgi:hypothetical protein